MSVTKRVAMLFIALAVVTAASLYSVQPTQAGKPKGGGGSTSAYVATDLGGLTVNGMFLDTRAHGISNPDQDGVVQVVGYSHVIVTPGFTPWHAYAWSATTSGAYLATSDLGTLPGNNSSYANAINDEGLVVGYNYHNPWQAFVEVPNVGMLPLPKPGLAWSTAFAVNNWGTIIGQGGVQQGVAGPGLLWQINLAGNIDGPIDLSAFVPSDINDDGLMVGETAGLPAVAMIDENQTPHVAMLGLLPGYTKGAAFAVNSFGDVVGECRNSLNTPRAVVWPAGNAPIALKLLANTTSSAASDINDGGQIVGWSKFSGGFTNGILWHNGDALDINQLVGLSTSGKTLHVIEGTAINSVGQIAGIMRKTNFSGQDRAVLISQKP